ncbi:MAG: M16 family metallopeptidase [Candidatus Aminicenantes bacterium]
MVKKRFFCICLVLILWWAPASSQQQNELPFHIDQHKLENGLQVILSEDFSLPLVSVAVAYHVGSINEEPGKAGIAYLLENLMFQGSENVGRMQHISFIHRIGGELNAVTTEDKTIFYQTVPSNQLALVLWLESDRMNSLEISASNVERVRDSLIEEIQYRKEADPYLESSVSFDQLLFPDFAHSHPVFGSVHDLRDITVEEVKDFYSTYYRPNNAVLCITGDIKKRKALQLVRKYFATIPEGDDIDPVPEKSFPEEKSVVRTRQETLASLPAFFLGYRIASPFSDDYYPLRIIEYILLRGKTSRLYKRLIKKDRTAFGLGGGIDSRRELAAFKIFTICNNDIMVERSKKAVLSEINKLKTSLISEEELRKSKNMFKMDYINQYATYMDRAVFLAQTYLAQNNPDDFPQDLQKYLKVTPPEIIGIMNRYFTQKNILLNVKTK